MGTQSGFTLVALLVALAIVGLIAFFSLSRIYSPIPTETEVHEGIQAINAAEQIQDMSEGRVNRYNQYLSD